MPKYTFKASLEYLEAAIDVVVDSLGELGIDHKAAYKIHLALDELLTNVVSYAYEDEVGNMDIIYEIKDDPKVLEITIIDEGKPFNPLELKDPDLDSGVSERKIGGLGIFIVRQIMDEMEYVRKDNKNILTIRKKV